VGQGGDPAGAVDVGRHQVRREAVLGVVGHGLGLGGEPVDGGDGSEDFLVHDRGVGGDVVQHGRGCVVPRPVRDVSLGDDNGATGHGVLNEAADLVHRPVVGQRA
jgi:hypothetical protein